MKGKVEKTDVSIFESDDSRVRWLVATWAIAFGWMLWLTYPLWTSDTNFPQIPSHDLASYLPQYLDRFLWLTLLAAIGLLAVANVLGFANRHNEKNSLGRDRLKSDFLKRSLNWLVRLLATVTLAVLALLILQNQQRFLPWVTQGMLILTGILLFSKRDLIRFTQMLCISIYIYSAISKYDVSFVNGIGNRFFEVPFLASFADALGNEFRGLLILMLPTFELLIGIGLCFQQTHKVSLVCGMAMHLTLLLILGPFGLQNAGSVLVWNLFFAVQLPILFYQRKTNEPERPESRSFNTALPVASFIENLHGFLPKQLWIRVIFFLVALFPLASRFNWIDHWSGWELYASSSSYCTLRVSGDEIRKLQKPLPYLMTGRDEFVISEGKDEKLRVDMFGWSLRELNAPIYPQDRFQLAACVAILEEHRFKAFELTLYSESNWWTGSRDSKTFYRLDEAKMHLSKYKGHTDVRSGKSKE